MVTPHQMLQPHPTRQNRTVNNWPTPTMRLTINAPNRDFGPATAENLGCPVQRLNRPLQTVPRRIELNYQREGGILILLLRDKPLGDLGTRYWLSNRRPRFRRMVVSMFKLIVPVPGSRKFHTRQNQASGTGRQGMAPRMTELCSTKTSGNLAFGSCGIEFSCYK